ncbi:MAG: NrpR regulatory domain-containing protein [bacterium]
MLKYIISCQFVKENMLDLNERKTNTILKIISEANKPIGSADIAGRLKELGINLSERTVRYHLKMFDKHGLTETRWRTGRLITNKGLDELSNAGISDKIGLISSRIEHLSYSMDFDLANRAGRAVINLTLFHQSEFKKALTVMREVFSAGLSMGDRVLLARAGQRVGETVIPSGRVAFGTLCAINLNGILLKHGIPIQSRFGGVLQISESRPLRFTELVSYDGSTLDPHEIFIRSHMTNVRDAARKGEGKVLAGLREIPAASKQLVLEIISEAKQAGFGEPLFVGNSGEAVLGMPIVVGKVGIVIPGGLNPIAACEEWGIETENKALSALVDYSKLVKFSEIV